MRSARRSTKRVAFMLICVLILAVTAAGCQTTEETAAIKRTESKRILEARKQHRAKSHDQGSERR